MGKPNKIWGIDLGSAKIAVALMEYEGDKSCYVRQVASVGSQGIIKGKVVDFDACKTSLQEALRLASEGQKTKPMPALISLGGESFVLDRVSFGIEKNSSQPIKAADLKKIEKKIKRYRAASSEEILMKEYLPYYLDKNKLTQQPLMLSAQSVERKVLMQKMNKTYKSQLIQMLESLDIEAWLFLYAPYASSEMMLSQEEKRSGTIQIELGHQVSSVHLWRQFRLERSESVWVGGHHVENDMIRGLQIAGSQARSLLGEQVQIMPADIQKKKISLITDEGTTREVEFDFVCKVAQARIHEIFSLIWHKVQAWKKEGDIPENIVLTGGLSQINKMDDFCQKIFSMRTRRGIPQEKWDLIDDPIYSQAIGSVFYAQRSKLLQKPSGFWSWLWG